MGKKNIFIIFIFLLKISCVFADVGHLQLDIQPIEPITPFFTITIVNNSSRILTVKSIIENSTYTIRQGNQQTFTINNAGFDIHTGALPGYHVYIENDLDDDSDSDEDQVEVGGTWNVSASFQLRSLLERSRNRGYVPEGILIGVIAQNAQIINISDRGFLTIPLIFDID